MTRRGALALAVLALGTSVLSAQTQTDADSLHARAASTTTLLARADSLFAIGAHDEARAAYRDLLEADPNNSRAIYRLGVLAPSGSSVAVELFTRYTELEGDDAWGWIALAEAFADGGDIDGAIDAYARALEVDSSERDAFIPRARLLLVIGDLDGAVEALDAWLLRHNSDVEAWRLLARVHRANGDTDREIAALVRAGELDPQDDSRERLDALRARTAPAIEPSIASSTDSDGSGVNRMGLSGDFALGSRSRLGLQLERATASDAEGEETIDRGLLYYTTRGDVYRLDVRAGMSLREGAKGRLSRSIEPIGRLRVRWATDADAPGVDVRLQRTLLDANATMISNGIVLEEAFVGLDVPAGQTVSIRLLGATGALVDDGKRNWRFRIGGGPQFAVAPGVRVGVQYDGTTYLESARSGYFAPALAHTLEAAAYGEIEELGDFSIAADVGAGIQQIIEEEGDAGTISPAFRGWGSVAWNFAPSSSVALELEGYNLVGGSAVAGGSSGWSYGSVALTLRWAL